MTLAPDRQATAADECVPATPGAECCSLSGGPMGVDDAHRIAGRLKALSDPTRLRKQAEGNRLVITHIGIEVHSTVQSGERRARYSGQRTAIENIAVKREAVPDPPLKS